ncbi:MAG: DMT family transporter [Acidobacteriaceae bacterium]
MALIASAAFCWGASATVGKAVFNGIFAHSAAAITPLVLAQTRTTFSFLILAPLLLIAKPSSVFSIRPRQLLGALLVGMLGVSGSNFFYYYAIQQTSVSAAIVLQYLAPIWVLIYMVARGEQRATLSRLLGVSLAVVGIALVIGIGGGGTPYRSLLGFAAAVLAGISFAFYNLGGSVLLRSISVFSLMVYTMLGSALLWAFINPIWKLARTPFTPAQWWFLVGFAVFSMLIPYLLYSSGLRHLDPTSAIVTSCLEPVFAIMLAVGFVGESLHPLQILGIILVLSATVLIQKTTNTSEVPSVPSQIADR